MVELGLITPPIGINVFTVKSVIPSVELTQIFAGVVPFVIADLVVLALIFLVPGLADFPALGDAVLLTGRQTSISAIVRLFAIGMRIFSRS